MSDHFIFSATSKIFGIPVFEKSSNGIEILKSKACWCQHPELSCKLICRINNKNKAKARVSRSLPQPCRKTDVLF